MTTQFFDPKHMTQISEFYASLQDLIKECDLNPIGDSKGDLFINEVIITVRHADGWNIGQFELEDGLLLFNMDIDEGVET